MKVKTKKLKIKNLLYLTVFCFFLVNMMGCEAFVRKFTRKPKKENMPREEMVIAPQEYKGPQLTKEEQYRQYFLFWKSWHGELIESLTSGTNHKKQVDCIDEAIDSLNQMRSMLNEEKQKKLDVYINQMKDLLFLINKDMYGSSAPKNRINAEHIRMDILKNFSYEKIKDYLT